MFRCCLVILMLATGRVPAASDFAGTWVLRADGQNIFRLTLAAQRHARTGSLTKPKGLTIDHDGDVRRIGPEQVNLPVQKAKLQGARLELTIDGDLSS